MNKSCSRLVEAVTDLIRRDGGNVAIIFALLLPVLLGAAGLGVETSYWYYRSLKLQSAADAAAYAGELENMAGSPTDTVHDVALTSAVSNGLETAAGDIEVYTPPASGPNTSKHAVEVILEQRLPRYFTAMFSEEPVVLRARAVARSEPNSRACILALDRKASKAALFSGNTSVALTGCSVMSNSAASDAVTLQGAAELEVDCLIAVGGVSAGSGATMTSCSVPITYAQYASDPFLDVPQPEPSGGCKSAKGATLQPGTYCKGLALSGTVHLSPGVYVVDGGDFKVNANAFITGTGVTVYITCGNRVSMNGNAAIQLNAPTSGTYSGMLFMGDRTCADGSHTFNGDSHSSLTGAIYFAKQQVNYLGNYSGDGGCSQVVAGTIQWSGSTTISQDCTALGMKDIPAHQQIRLVE